MDTQVMELDVMVRDDMRTLVIDADLPLLISCSRGNFKHGWEKAEGHTPGLTALADMLIALVELMGSNKTDAAYILQAAKDIREAFFDGISLVDNGPGKVGVIARGMLAAFVSNARKHDTDHQITGIAIAGILLRHTPKDIVRQACQHLEAKRKSKG
jgi:hypothetical protein